MAIKNVGKGSQYAIAYLDEDGDALDGSKTYKINLPKNVPAKDFWSFTLYDNQTRGSSRPISGSQVSTAIRMG